VTEQRTFVITGTRQGLGRALAAHYLASDHKVFGVSRGESDLVHSSYRHFCADVADDKALRGIFSDIAAAGDLHVLINAAGVKINQYALLTSPANAEQMIRTNLLGAFLVTQNALRIMKRKRFGRVISLSSIAVPLGSGGTAVYGATKAGLEQMAYALSREFAPDDITFNTVGISVYPDSAMVQALDPAALQNTRASLIKPGDLKLEEIVAAVNFFASPVARNITNQTLYFGGLR
jgi:3-oxoacyl-[acyl-carrier protein] reductase